MMFPKFTYPVWSISLTLSIFLTVGIAHERYIAIKYPIIHRQRMRSGKYRRITLMKYTVCVLLCAIIFNLPKFFEIEIDWRDATSRAPIDEKQRYQPKFKYIRFRVFSKILPLPEPVYSGDHRATLDLQLFVHVMYERTNSLFYYPL